MTASHVTEAWSCTIRLVVEDDRVLAPAARDLTDLLARVDRAASRFRPDSALTRANARAGRPVPVPPLLIELVDAALTAAADTDGAVDPTLGRCLAGLGYDVDIAAVRDRDLPARAPVGHRADAWRFVRVHRAAALLTVPAGTALDLGATTKAWTADHAAATLSERYRTPVLVELGGDVAVAGRPDGGWQLHVAEREGGAAQPITLTAGGLATSTTTLRRWRVGGRPVHHLLDPRTGAPADGPWRTATVAADSAVLANTASTAAIVLGERAESWLADHRLAARLVGRDGRVVTTGSWPTENQPADNQPADDHRPAHETHVRHVDRTAVPA